MSPRRLSSPAGDRRSLAHVRWNEGLDRIVRISDFVIRNPLTNNEVDEGLGPGVLEMVSHRLSRGETDIRAGLQDVLLRAEVQHGGTRQRVEVLLFVGVPMPGPCVRAWGELHHAYAHFRTSADIAQSASADFAIGAGVPDFRGHFRGSQWALDRTGSRHVGFRCAAADELCGLTLS